MKRFRIFIIITGKLLSSPTNWCLHQLRDTNSYGSDRILKFVKDTLPIIMPYLTCIINMIIVTGTFPTTWQHALITPIYRVSNPEDPSNYRSITLLPILSKILEKIVATQSMKHLESNNLLSNKQQWFWISWSTMTALLKIFNRIYQNMEKIVSILVSCDLSKAFDRVCTKFYLEITDIGIDSFWFEQYLSHWT